MEIKTKYNIGDVLFYLKDNLICSSPVTDIHIIVHYSGGTSIDYQLLNNNMNFPAKQCEASVFKTKKELIEHLSK